METVTKLQLCRQLAQRCQISPDAAKAFINALTDLIGEELSCGHQVRLPGFGTFKLRHISGHLVHIPRTGEIVMSAETSLPAFKASRVLKQRVKDTW